LSRISAIVVGLVAVDADSLKLLTAGEAAALSSQFVVPSAGEMPVAKWSPVINNIISAGATSPPLSVRQALRVYQRVYPINPFGEHSL
jgi:hypothetical protein